MATNFLRKQFDTKHLYRDSNQVAIMTREQIFFIQPDQIGRSTIGDAITKLNKDFEKLTTKAEMRENLEKVKILNGILELKKVRKLEKAFNEKTGKTASPGALADVDQAEVDALLKRLDEEEAQKLAQQFDSAEQMGKIEARLKRKGGKTKRNNKSKRRTKKRIARHKR